MRSQIKSVMQSPATFAAVSHLEMALAGLALTPQQQLAAIAVLAARQFSVLPEGVQASAGDVFLRWSKLECNSDRRGARTMVSKDESAQDSVECRIRLLRAGGVGRINPPRLTIEAHEQIHDVGSLEEARELHSRQGIELANAILASLPGGTVDVLLVELMRRRASLLSVPLEG